ncbi:trypsin-like serine protease [Bacteriovorax sp. PP10]|uniref:Trypsin-like serine protease n=1 Tax=Bacteriovorax antarcticus TaxID=3088717 RepID=A0ABU5VTC8_9BACT|nr:trypsin-like serine protease [Bacteriovorax sp. PP10]MEA9355619.1 trypsin-like serine protease [Bacteriovorax sp. PP10]
MFIRLIAMVACTLLTLSAEAIVNGKDEAGMPAVVMLEGGGGVCSGSIVGLNPLTVITAKHCAYYGAIQLKGTAPAKVVFDKFPTKVFNPARGDSPGDIVILIYPQELSKEFNLSKEELFTVAPLSLKLHDSVSFCGYGSTNLDAKNITDNRKKRCGQNNLIIESEQYVFQDNYNRVVNSKDFTDLSPRELSEFLQTTTQFVLSQYEVGSRLAVELVSDPSLSVPAGGDSGGPWFVKSEDSRLHLIGVHSIVYQSPKMSAIAAGFSWKLDHPWVKQLLLKAALEGADINGIDELK